MKSEIEKKVIEWDNGDRDPSTHEPLTNYTKINSQIDYLEKRLFTDYEPLKGPSFNFRERLYSWLQNIDCNEDQQILFRLIPQIFFVGREEFDTLYRVSFNDIITRWLVNKSNIAINDANLNTKLVEAKKQTWFCPVTDSMRINAFYHINGLTEKYRPDWYSLSKFGSKEAILKYINTKKFKRIVLLEDFVASGSQIVRSVQFASSLSPDLQILVLPLIVCPKGVVQGLELENECSNITFEPLIRIPDECCVNHEVIYDESDFFYALRDLAIRSYPKVSGETYWPHGYPPHSPFGHRKTGSLTVLFSNCPDNTLPIIHHKHDTWEPLFPRSTRQ